MAQKTPKTGNLSRRAFFTTGKKIGVSLLAFIPATGMLFANAPQAHAQIASASPDYVACSQVTCTCQGYRCWDSTYQRWGIARDCYDARNPSEFCYTDCSNPSPC